MKKGQKVYRQAKYSYSSTTQDVVTFRKFEDKSQSDVENKVVSNEKSIKWMNFTGNLKIIKEDEETGESKEKGFKNILYCSFGNSCFYNCGCGNGVLVLSEI